MIYESLRFLHNLRTFVVASLSLAIFALPLIIFTDISRIAIVVAGGTAIIMMAMAWLATEQLGSFLDTKAMREYFEEKENEEELKKSAKTKKVPVKRFVKNNLRYKEADGLTQADVDRRFKTIRERMEKRKKKDEE